MLKKCFKCGSIIKNNFCENCQLSHCNSCGNFFKKELMSKDTVNCLKCYNKLNNSKGFEIKRFVDDRSGIIIKEKEDKQIIKIEKKGDKSELSSFQTK